MRALGSTFLLQGGEMLQPHSSCGILTPKEDTLDFPGCIPQGVLRAAGGQVPFGMAASWCSPL